MNIDFGSRRMPVDLTGQRFGQLTVIDQAGYGAGVRPPRLWRVRCDCGVERILRTTRLRRGHCGCQGYRRSAVLHQVARAKVPARTRRAIARKGGNARKGKT